MDDPKDNLVQTKLTSDLYEALLTVSKELDRPVSWIVRRSLEQTVPKCFTKEGEFSRTLAIEDADLV